VSRPGPPAGGAAGEAGEGEDGEIAELVRLATSAAQRAGALVRDQRPARVAVERTKSSPTDVVTAMDNAAEDLLREVLTTARPGDGVLGEERGLLPGSTGLIWVVDPIDGTVNYLYGIATYAVSVAAVRGDPTVPGAWTPIAGCVHNPETGQTWTASVGRGAWLDGRPLQLGVPPPLDRALVATGFGYRPGRRSGQARVLARLLPQIRDIRRQGSAAIDLCQVASGNVDAYYERGVHAWDVAAAMLVVTEAGGRVSGLGGRAPSPDMVVAAADPLCTSLADALLAAGAEDDDPEEPQST
jgi:myo-inositol-1(or 4)-monophosphatase